MGKLQRRVMRAVNTLNTGMYRRSAGKRMGMVKGVPVLLLTVAGRTTGILHTVPVTYFERDGSWLVVGSAGGMKDEPQWFRNLRACQQARVQIGASHVEVAVSVADKARRDELWEQVVRTAPFFDGYQKKVSREIPIAVLTPTREREAVRE